MVLDAGLALKFGFSIDGLPPELRWIAGTSMALAAVLSIAICGGYFRVLRKSRWWQGGCVALAAAMAVGMGAVALAQWGIHLWARSLALAFAMVALGLLSIRLLLITAHRFFLRKKKVWVVAEDLAAAQVMASKVENDGWRYEVKRCSHLLRQQDMQREMARFDAILCPASFREAIAPICSRQGTELLLVPDSSDILLHGAAADHMGDLLVLSLAAPNLTAQQRLCKRLLDLLGATVLLALSCPLMLILHLLIRLESHGPAIFAQARRGHAENSFDMLKFRTMVEDAERFSGPVLASRDDPRVTRLGHLLRATRLDELPQLFNVLRGEMSLVGPRPERECFAEKFEREIPHYRWRTRVKPGITGLAQVWGSYSSTAEDKLRLDLAYIVNFSVWLDLKLLAQTVRVILQRKQAAGLPSSGPRALALSALQKSNQQP